MFNNAINRMYLATNIYATYTYAIHRPLDNAQNY